MNRYMRWWAMALLVCTATAFASQVGKLTGRIIDKTTREGLPGITVMIVPGATASTNSAKSNSPKTGCNSDVDGNFVLMNISSGMYTVRFSGVGYHDLTVTGVSIRSDLTTSLNAQLVPESIAQEEIIVTAARPMIQRDLTASREIKSSEEIKALPVDNLRGILKMTAGVSGDNFRGGRAGEVAYIVDGVSFVDPMTGNMQGDIPTAAIEELSVMTGGYSAEYGNAQSGVVQQVIKEGGPRFSGMLDFKLSRFNASDNYGSNNITNPVFTLEGPLPLRGVPGTLGFFAGFEQYKTKGRFNGTDSTLNSFTGKLTYNITPQHKLAFTTVYSDNKYRMYRHLWSRSTIEDDSYLPLAASPSPLDSWYRNGALDTEDRNHNGLLDVGEDLDGDGVVDSEDLNNNGSLDVLSMFDHTSMRKRITRSFSLDWTHAVSKNTFYTIRLSQWSTRLRWNVDEKINEDMNGNGVFENESWFNIGAEPDSFRMLPDQFRHVDNPSNPTRAWFDWNRNGSQDQEDLNGNGVWDWQEYGSGTDLFADANNNGYIDASESRQQSEWLAWKDIPFGNSKDPLGYFSYGKGFTYFRDRWHDDSRKVTTMKGVVTSQVHPFHQIKSGAEMSLYKIFQYDVDLASGGNVYGERFNVSPRSYGLFAEDKYESEGMIVNVGMRWDFFDPNYSNYPANISDPVLDAVNGGTVKQPVKVNLKSYFSPRLGISFPFSKRDLLHFNYGRFFQNPRMNLLFTNLNFDLSGAFPIIGNANLSPERTTAYEIGVKHLLTDDMTIDVTGFYKDITGLVDTKQVYYTATDWYGLYVNTDYGNIRGMEISLTKRMSSFVGGSANYTYSVAKGKSSTTRSGYEAAYYEQKAKTTENYLDWDQRHAANINLQLYCPKGTNLGYSFLSKPLASTSATFIFSYGSGYPFSSPARNIDPPINDQRLPDTYNLDLRLDKTFALYKESKATVYAQINNVFDRKNIDGAYFQAGGAGASEDTIDPGWYLADQDGNGSPDHDADGRWNDPKVFQEGRTVTLGLQISF